MVTISQRHRTELKLSPYMLMGTRILQMSGPDLDEAIKRELEDNPALERVSEYEPLFKLSGTRITRGTAVSQATESRVDPMAALKLELEVLAPQPLRELAFALLYSLDERGYLSTPLSDLAARWGVSPAHLEEALAVIHHLDIPGLGARSLQECLVLQCDYLENLGVGCGIVPRLLRDGWDAFIAAGRRDLADRLGVGADELDEATRFIARNLYPYPIALLERSAEGPYLQWSDIIVSRNDASPAGEWVIELPSRAALALRVSESFGRALERAADTAVTDNQAWGDAYVRRAREFILSLNRRWQTLEAIAECLAERQGDYVSGSAKQPRPLTRRAVAEHLGIHESTVSRAVSDKTMQLPDGRIVPMAAMFGGSALRTEVSDALRTQKEKGLSDRQIVDALRIAGINVSRRTVGKYRVAAGVS